MPRDTQHNGEARDWSAHCDCWLFGICVHSCGKKPSTILGFGQRCLRASSLSEDDGFRHTYAMYAFTDMFWPLHSEVRSLLAQLTEKA
jgi:hypothetical protein